MPDWETLNSSYLPKAQNGGGNSMGLEYFKNNYLNQFITNKLPTVEEDAAVFDLKEGKDAKAQKFMDDNKLS